MRNILLGLVLCWVSGALMAKGDAQAGKAHITNCVACHGPTGVGIAPNFPNLAGQGERYLVKQMLSIQSGKRSAPLMTGMLDGFSQQDLQDIAAYFAKQPAPPVGAVDAAQQKRGEAIYRGGIAARHVPACTACHGADGSGLALAGFPRLAGQSNQYLIKQLKAYRDDVRTTDGDTTPMRTITKGLLDKDIEAVASYINGLYR